MSMPFMTHVMFFILNKFLVVTRSRCGFELSSEVKASRATSRYPAEPRRSHYQALKSSYISSKQTED